MSISSRKCQVYVYVKWECYDILVESLLPEMIAIENKFGKV